MELIEFADSMPLRPNRRPISRLRSLLTRKRLSRAGKTHVDELLERELLNELEGESYSAQLERHLLMADGEIRARHFLEDQHSRFSTLTQMRCLGYVAAEGQKRVNVINDYMRQTTELARRQPHLAEQVEEMQRQFLSKVNGAQEIT